MTDKKSKMNKGKKLPKGMRQYIRRLKREARKEDTVYRAPIIHHNPAKTTES